jgi:hypothetical protein
MKVTSFGPVHMQQNFGNGQSTFFNCNLVVLGNQVQHMLYLAMNALPQDNYAQPSTMVQSI